MSKINQEILTIVIPTYNRKQRLLNLLNSIFNEKDVNYKIIICDNKSDYDIREFLEQNISDENYKKIQIVIREINTGMIGNLPYVMTLVKTRWFWTISDDDEIVEGAIRKIYDEIKKNTNVGLIKFSTEGIQKNGEEEDLEICSLEEFIDYYYKDKNRRRSGNLVFFSNNVFNLEKIKKYLRFSFEYSYTQVPHIIPILIGLSEKDIQMKFSSKKIVKYIPPDGDHWSVKKIALGALTFSHLPLKIDNKYRRKFLEVIMWIDYKWCIVSLLNTNDKESNRIFNQLYYGIYREYLPVKDKFIAKIFCYILREKNNQFLLKLFKTLKKLKKG